MFVYVLRLFIYHLAVIGRIPKNLWNYYILAATATQSDDRHNMQRAFARICKVYVCDKEHQRMNTELVLLIKLPEKQGLRVFRPLYLDVERVKRLMS